MTLIKYRQKRKFDQTPEPKASKHAKGKALRFVVQEHHASHLHWDFRLEMEGVLKSWAVPKGPSLDPTVKHLAVQVEDHPYSYRTFTGTIPEGNYGAGTVKIWDEGTYEPLAPTDNPEKTLLQELKKGDLKIVMHGKRLKGEFALVKFAKQEKNWLLIKHRDAFASSILPPPINEKGKKASMPHEIKPMLAKLADEVFDDPDWVYEIKWDGYRALAEVQKGKVRLYSRNNQDFNAAYPIIVEAVKEIPHDVILDGEIVAVDNDGKAQFQLLQDYRKNKEVTLIYYVFDLLYLDGYDLRDLPLLARKEKLVHILPQNQHLKYSDHIVEHGMHVFEFAKKKGLEGIIAKRKGSRYVSSRSGEWQKIKHIQMQEAVICGFTEPKGQRKEFGALILGLFANGEYRYIGHTGGGFDDKKLRDIIAMLKPLETDKSPFATTPQTNAPATWVKPKIVAQIKFSEWTKDGVMRQPIFLGLRTDKKPEEVTAESVAQPLKTKAELTNLHKVFWPDEGYTKGDVIAYYDRIAPYILPYLKDRPESMLRQPNGIAGESFFQKDMQKTPEWVEKVSIHSPSEDKLIHWVVCNDRDTLLYMANLGCIEINPWSARTPSQKHPDYLIIDLDPHGIDFTEVITTAKFIKKLLDKAKIPGFLKTSGKKGMHILLPLGAQYTYDQSRQFAELIARIVAKELPQTTSVIRDPSKREKKIYIDFLQNRIGQTITSPYSLRPVPGACVSTPLEWTELTPSLRPTDFTIKNIFRRLGKKGDIWKGFLNHKGINMQKSLDILTTSFPL